MISNKKNKNLNENLIKKQDVKPFNFICLNNIFTIILELYLL